jgi:hypothetical protein
MEELDHKVFRPQQKACLPVQHQVHRSAGTPGGDARVPGEVR